jgi:hypothetical protein
MKQHLTGWALAVCILVFSGSAAQAAPIPALARIPDGISRKQKDALNQRKQLLEAEVKSFQADAADFNAKPAADQTDQEFNALQTQRSNYVAAVEVFNAEVGDIRSAIAMNAYAKRMRWEDKKRARLETALNALHGDGDDSATDVDVLQAWRDISSREGQADLLRAASQGDGPKIIWSGRQSHQDCAVFALASATGLPYSVAATRAAELISQGEWRSAEQRAHPQQTIESTGLTGGEIVLLAEDFGSAEVVQSSDFARTLKSGRAVLTGVVPDDGNVQAGHMVVLSKTFQRGGETWFEMMDSNYDHPLYLSTKELNTILLVRGVAYSPAEGTVPNLLR